MTSIIRVHADGRTGLYAQTLPLIPSVEGAGVARCGWKWQCDHAAMRRMHTTLRIVALCACVAVAACASLGAPLPSRATAPPTELVVENIGPSDVTVYAIHDGRKERVDRVYGAYTAHLWLPARIVASGDTQIRIERLGGPAGFRETVTTQSVAPTSCQRLQLSIEPTLAHTTLAVYPSPSCHSKR
jgi:hypothetical protein